MSGNESTKEFKIISLLPYIKSNPIIYDKKRKDFKDIEKKEDVWRKIAFELGTSVEECQRYWKSTRERYSRERKFCRMNSKYSEWPLYRDMSFLAKHILPRNAKRGHINNSQNIRQPTEFIVLPTSSSSPRSAICDNNNSSNSTMDVYLHDNSDNDNDILNFDPPKSTINQQSPTRLKQQSPPPLTLHLLEPIVVDTLQTSHASLETSQGDNNDSSGSDSSYEYVTTSETQHPTQLEQAEGQRHLKDKRSVVRNRAGRKRTRLERRASDENGDGGNAATVEKTLDALSRYLLAKDDVNMAFGRYVARALQESPQDVQKSKMLAIVKILTD